MKLINVFNNLTVIFIFKLAVCSESKEAQSKADCTKTFSDDQESFFENKISKPESNEIEKLLFDNEDFENFIFLMKKSFNYYEILGKNNIKEQNINNQLLSVILCLINKSEIALETKKYEIYFKKSFGLVDNFIRLLEKKIKFSKRMFFLISLEKIISEYEEIVKFLPKLIDFFKEKVNKSNSAVFTFFEKRLDYLLPVFNEIISNFEKYKSLTRKNSQVYEKNMDIVVFTKDILDKQRNTVFPKDKTNWLEQRMSAVSTLDLFKGIGRILMEECKLLKSIFEDFKKIWKSKTEITDLLKTLKGDA